MVPRPDTTHLPRGERDLRRLIDALAASDDREERHFLELKRSIDGPTGEGIDLTRKSGFAKVAKFILGAANRMPDRALAYFDGRALMLLGIGPDGATGIEPVESHLLERGVLPYLSVDGPGWDLLRCPVSEGREVLVIVVEPPQWGQAAFPAMAEGDGIRNGTIYVRADGETRPATGEEVRQLHRRAAQGRPTASIEVQLNGAALSSNFSALRDEFVRAERDRLLHAYQASEARTSNTAGPALWQAPLFGAKRVEEARTHDEYTAEIDDWASRVHLEWPRTLDRSLADLWEAPDVVVTNLSSTFLEDVHVKIHLAGPIDGVASEVSSHAALRDWLPSAPRVWGPSMTGGLTGMTALAGPAFQVFPASVFTPDSRRVSFENSGSVTISVNVGDLRPRDTFRDAGVVLLVRDDSIDAISGRWSMTCRGHDEVYKDTINVSVADSAGVRDVLASELGL